MGRGLSDLQKRILTVVYERRQERDFEAEEGEHWENQERWKEVYGPAFVRPYWVYYDMRHAQVLAKLYDWPDRWGKRASEGRHVSPYGGHHFRRHVVGFKEYNSKTAAYYRAVSRLKRRGLLADRGAGLWITDEGMRVVENLSVSKAAVPAVS
jgi:hypothetical protein